MKSISYAKLQENYAGEYIARRDGHILAHAKTYSRPCYTYSYPDKIRKDIFSKFNISFDNKNKFIRFIEIS